MNDTETKPETKPETFAGIAREIRREWRRVYFGAIPYLEALETLETSDPSASFFCETAKDTAIGFLANAAGYRGPNAHAHKARLCKLAGLTPPRAPRPKKA